MSLDLTLTRNYLGIMMPLSPDATNGVTGTGPGQTLYGKKGVSNWIISPGGGSTLIGSDSGDTFFVVDPTDSVTAAPNSGINTVVSWTSYYMLPANVQNLFLQSASGGIGVGNNLDNLLVAEGASNYTLVAGTGNDVMIGNGSGDPQYDTGGGSTTFIIAQGGGNDVIANFRSGIDVIRLDGFTNLTDFASVQAAMTQVGSDVVLNLGNNQTLTLRSETIAGFRAADFMLPAHLTGMTLRFADEFNSFVSSPTGAQGWTTQGGTYWRTLPSNNELEYYSDSSVGVNPFSDSNGVLTITAAPGTNPLGLPYNSGIITTEKSFNFEYGLVEVSAKLPAGAGLWPAIWLLPSNLGWPPEIDIMEMLGSNPNLIYASTHSGSNNTSSTLQAYVGDTTQSFHTYGLDWEPDHITWYFDGNAIRTMATPADMHQPMYLLINLAVGGPGSWPGAPTSAAEFPAQMQIESVRIYGSSATTAVAGTAAMAPGPSVTISGDTALSAVGPVVTAVAITPASGDLGAGSMVTLNLTFSAAVTVAGGNPTLALNDGGTATYISGSGSSTLVFSYTVAAGQNTTDLALAASNALTLNGATIRGSAGNDALLTAANGISLNGTLQIDTMAPTIAGIATSPGSGQVETGSTVDFTVTFSETVTVLGGAPALALNDGGTATYVSGSGSNTLVFSYTVTAGQNTTDLALKASNALALNGATIRDGAGNNAVLTAADGYNPAAVLQVNPTSPPISPSAQQVVVSGWWNTYSLGNGTYSVSGTAGGADIILGDGNQTVNVAGTNNQVRTGDGNQIITFTGNNNRVTTGAGASTIVMSGAYEDVQVGATPTGTTTITGTGFGEVITSTGPGNLNFSGSTGNSSINLGDGNDSIALGGSGNSVALGVGTSTVHAGIGQGVVHTGGGSDTIYVSGWNNLIDAGPGMNFIHGGRGNDTFVLNGAGQGTDTIWGFSLTNSDKLDLSRALAGIASKVDLANVGNYITAAITGQNTTLYVDPSGGHGTQSAFAILEGVKATIAQLAAHHALIVP